jgi:acyl-coenzyme A thioesterase PaaI-like protein
MVNNAVTVYKAASTIFSQSVARLSAHKHKKLCSCANAMAHKYSQRFLDVIMNEFSSKTFSVSFMPYATGFVHKQLQKGVSFHYVVPETLCRSHLVNGEVGRPQFSAAAMMAIFDEVSSYSCAMKDRKMRPGLSVHLSTEIMKNMYAGDELTLLTGADKIGNALGYASLEVLNKEGDLVARGKHIKHLPMGLWFDFITHPLIAPFSLWLSELKSKRRREQMAAEGVSPVQKVTGLPALTGVGRVFDLLGLTSFTESLPLHSDRHPNEDGSLYCSDDGRVDPAEVRSYTMTVKQITSNLRRTMHGGAVGCAVEQACLLSRSRNTQADGTMEGSNGIYDLDCYIQSLEVRYISPMKGDLVITTANDRHSPLLRSAGTGQESGVESKWCQKSIGKVFNKKNGALCAEYVCTWALIE